jgi:hypothetical protein
MKSMMTSSEYIQGVASTDSTSIGEYKLSTVSNEKTQV